MYDSTFGLVADALVGARDVRMVMVVQGDGDRDVAAVAGAVVAGDPAKP